MDAHFLSSNPTSSFNSTTSGTSLIVRMFLAVARGEAPVHAPDNGFRTVKVVGEERYCLNCKGIRWMDVVHGEFIVSGQGSALRIFYCRSCEWVGAL